jgi:hypothetical protein
LAERLKALVPKTRGSLRAPRGFKSHTIFVKIKRALRKIRRQGKKRGKNIPVFDIDKTIKEAKRKPRG